MAFPRIKRGATAATLDAADWGQVLLALELRRCRLARDGHASMAADVRLTAERLDEQVREDALDALEREVEGRRQAEAGDVVKTTRSGRIVRTLDTADAYACGKGSDDVRMHVLEIGTELDRLGRDGNRALRAYWLGTLRAKREYGF